MDDWINNLKLATEKFDTLVLASDTSILELEKLDKTKGGRDELWKEMEGLQKRVDYQKCQIEDYHELVEGGGRWSLKEFAKLLKFWAIGFWVKKRRFFLLKGIMMLLERYLPTFKEAYPIIILL